MSDLGDLIDRSTVEEIQRSLLESSEIDGLLSGEGYDPTEIHVGIRAKFDGEGSWLKHLAHELGTLVNPYEPHTEYHQLWNKRYLARV